MFQKEEFYAQCASGNVCSEEGVLDYIRSFKYVVIRGGSNLGEAVERKLKSSGIQVTVFWDMRYEELQNINGVPVRKPFSFQYPIDETLVILCIANHTIKKALTREIFENGYIHFLRGDMFYQGTICKFQNGMMLTAEQCWKSNECRPLICERATSIVKNRNQNVFDDERIDFTYIAFIVNSICNLKCKYCFQYISNYPAEKRENVPIEVLKRDVDLFMDIIDSTGSITVMGGETFLHPQIGEFIEYLCKKSNFGFISVASNGLVRIKPKQLEGMGDKRVAINFGSYLHVATEQEKENYYKNIELVKSYGITYTESIKLPRWTVPTTMYPLGKDEQYKIDRKQNCLMPPRDLQIRSGKVHVCDMALAMHHMGVADYPSDYVDLTLYPDKQERRNKLRELLNAPYYEACGYCNSCGKDAGEGGTQGHWNIFSPEGNE